MSTSTINNYKKIALDTWPRRQHYEFYRTMVEPNFNVCVNLNVEKLLSFSSRSIHSFYDSYLFATMLAVNNIENFGLRITDEGVVQCSDIGINATHLLDDKTFRFTYVQYAKTIEEFSINNKNAISEASNNEFISPAFKLNQHKLNTIYLSVLPWLNFTSFRHATDPQLNNGVPKLVYGKLDTSTKQMPLSIEVHHALVDGFHVGQFVEHLQKLLNNPEMLDQPELGLPS